MKRLIALLLCAAVLTGLISGCGKTGSSETAYVPTGDAILMEDEPDPTEEDTLADEAMILAYYPNRSMNPIIAMNFSNRVLFSLMYQGLFAYNSKNETVPILCSRYRVSPDNTIYTFYVDQNARFSDGTRVTAEDVIASYDAARESDFYKGRFTHIVSYGLHEDGEGIRFYLDTAYQNLPLLLDIPIVKASEVGAEHPLGTGPYVFRQNEDKVELVKNDNWWCSATLSVRANVITLMEATSQTQLRDEFEFGDLNLAIADPMLDSFGEYRCDYELWEVENGVLLYLSCNTIYSDWFKNDKNKTLQKALTYAIDRESLNEDNYRGMAQPATLITSPGSPYYYPSLAANYSYDAMKFLDAIGNLQFPRDKKTNEIQKLKLLVNSDDSARLRTARDIAAHLTELGIPCGVLEYGGTGPGITYQQVLNAGTYDIYLGQTKLPPNSDLSEFFKGYGNLGNKVLANETLLNMTKEALSNSGTFYNLCQMVAEDGSVIPVLYGCYNVYSKRGQLLDLQPARDNVFYYSIGRTMENILETQTEES